MGELPVVQGQVENVDELIHEKHTAKQEVSFISKKRNLLRVAAFVYIWFALSLTYYGVSLGKFEVLVILSILD